MGTAKQGHGQNNRLVIPVSDPDFRFYEQLTAYEKVYREIHGVHFLFVIEKTPTGEVHPCTVDDLAFLILNLPVNYFGELKTIILRRPRRKETILSPVWGRLVYSYAFEQEDLPVIVLESIQIGKTLRWGRKLIPEDQKELERLCRDGHPMVETRRHYVFELTPEASRNTQLYRTFLHELGHWVHYQQYGDFERYFQLPSSEKEAFAHRFADSTRQELIDSGIIPFPPKMVAENSIR